MSINGLARALGGKVAQGFGTVGRTLYNTPQGAVPTGDELGGLMGGNIAGQQPGILNRIGSGIGNRFNAAVSDPGGVQMLNMLARSLGGNQNQFINQLTGMTDSAAKAQQYAAIQQSAQERQKQQLQALIEALGGKQNPPIAGSPGTVAGDNQPIISPFGSGQPIQTSPVSSNIRESIPGAQSGSLRDYAVNSGMIAPMAQDILRPAATVNPLAAGTGNVAPTPAMNTQEQPQNQYALLLNALDPESRYMNAVIAAGQNPYMPSLPPDLTMGQLMGLTPEHLQQIIQNQQFDTQLRDRRINDFTNLQSQQADAVYRNQQLEAQQEAARLAQAQKEIDNFYRERDWQSKQAAPSTPKTLEQQTLAEWAARPENQGKTLMDFRREYSDAGRAPGSGGNESILTPEAIRQNAIQYATTGKMPTLGMGSAQARQAILNEAAKLFPDTDIGRNVAEFNADRTSLAQIQKSYDAIKSFEGTARKNLDILLDTLKDIPDTGNRWLNTPIRALSSGFGGIPVPVFNAARRIDVNEIARITSNPNLTGVLSDTARREIDELIPENATVAQVKKIAQLLRRDMWNRISSMDEQINEIKGRMSERSRVLGIDSDNPGASSGGNILTAVNPLTGERVQSTDGGQTWQPIEATGTVPLPKSVDDLPQIDPLGIF